MRSDRAGIPPLLKDDQTFTDSQDKANILNHYFCSVFSHDNNDDFPYIGDSPFPNMPPIELHCVGINKVLKSLDPSKAAGPDGLPSRYLKLIADELTPSLFLLFSASLQQGRIPADWKRAMITPIFKKGLRNDPTNYRPISLTSIICKVLERIIYSHIMSNLECHNVLNNAQFGFRQRRSADLQLLQTVHDLALGLNEKSQTDCIFLDFSKAFDKVSHHLLLLKLRYYGINGPLIKWITSFLTNRTQQVICDGSISKLANVTSGVPQGSVLGPLFFLLFINDLPESVHSSCRLFADDCLLYRQIHTTHDADVLQQDLLTLEQWADRWLMKFNPIKCVVLKVTNKACPIHKHYLLYNQELCHVTEAKYLGLTLDSHLTFSKHIDNICKKANITLGLIRRNTYHCQRYVKIDAYNTYVRPLLDYAAFVWSPHTATNTGKLESIQRRAARYVMSDHERFSSVSNMISVLNWKNLTQRRDIQSLCIFYKILNGLVDVSPPICVISNQLATRGHDNKFVHISSRVDTYKFSFFPRIVPLWNKLPDYAISAANFDLFHQYLNCII